MRRIKKILKWTGITILVIVAAITVVTASRQHLKYDAPYPSIKSNSDSASIARGRHLVISAAHCTDCHGAGNSDSLIRAGQEPVLSGSVPFALPVGTIYSANITSDSVYGIGRYTDGEVARVLRYGVHPEGEAVYDFMPFHNLSDEDLIDIISYLRTQKPVHQQKKDNELNTMGYLVKAFMVHPVGPSEPIVKSVKPDSSAEYGKYIVHNVGNCKGCHTLRTISGEYIGELMAGGGDMGLGAIPPNLTPDSSSRIFGWTQQMFVNRFRMGKLNPNSEMPWASFKRMNDTELKAIYQYLQTIKPVRTNPVLAQNKSR
jgi:mono/diheme cytochrome c family protein